MALHVSRALFIIDPQNCFMDKICTGVLLGLPKKLYTITVANGMPLPVPGADADMNRLAAYIKHDPFYYKTIIVTLDTHPQDHISHSVRWVDVSGKHPEPFTLISQADYVVGTWRAANPEDQEWQGEYLKLLEATGKIHTIWPVHGQEGEFEHQIHSGLQEALAYWEKMTGGKVQYVKKGMHRDTEQFGVFVANVPIASASETHMNLELVQVANVHDAVDFTAEAASHCAKDSTEQYLGAIPKSDWSKVTVLRDTMSPVAAVCDEEGNILVDFPAQAEEWLAGLPARGVAVDTVTRRRAA